MPGGEDVRKVSRQDIQLVSAPRDPSRPPLPSCFLLAFRGFFAIRIFGYLIGLMRSKWTRLGLQMVVLLQQLHALVWALLAWSCASAGPVPAGHDS